MEENKSLFRKESMDRISSPEVLSDYLKVTQPSVWVVLIAVILLLGGLLVWSGVSSVESYAAGTAELQNGVLTLSFDDEEKAAYVEPGMTIEVGTSKCPVLSVGEDEEGRLIAVAESALPDGSYEARVSYSSTQIIRMLFN